MSQLSPVELRTLAAAQIAAAMIADMSRDAAEVAIDEVAELAVRFAKAIEQAASESTQA
jgi:hypothetical protein